MEYEKVSHREHILKRPDTYVGSLEHDDFIGMSPAMLKIFDEILVNAFDEHMRDAKMNTIEVTVKGDRITVRNNKCIPVIMHPKEKMYVPELIFGHLLTSSNYDDTKDRYTGGRNGYGAKLTNVFSKEFTIVSQDPENEIEYTQTWRKNMSVCEPAKMKKYSKKSGWFSISFVPDGLFNEITLKRRVTEMGLWVPKVSFNGEHVSSTLEEFAKQDVYAYHKQGNWEILVARSTNGFEHISFVNGISTTTGGTHVDAVVSALCKSGAFGKECKPYQAKQHLTIFIKVLINKPTFSSQTKTECTSKNFNPIEFKPKFIKDVASLGIEDVLSATKLKKSDGVKRSKISGIPKLDDANWAGTGKSTQCTLIVTEGDSAKALAIAGLSVVGRDTYGVFPLKGKPKNVRDASVKQLESNKEFSDLKKILGLKQNEIYRDTKSLRYGRLMIMTDADLDGSHIKGLVINMFECFWPSLLDIGYIVAMVTPVIKADKKWFFTEDEFRNSSHKNSRQVKYYKGLGTSTSAEAKEYFKMLDKLTVRFNSDSKIHDSVTLAFAKDRVPDRKTWLYDYMELDQKPNVNYGHITSLSVTDFVQKDLIKFSEEDIKRSIPHLIDGLKPSQRKVIFACLKKNLEKDITVAQLAGYIGEQAAYHHGEASLQGTVIGLAQDFVGSNNMNLLVPSGQFGSRLEGGKDSASARYISTRLSPWTKHLFDEKDGPILNWLVEDAKSIEPEFYCPVFPIALINGCEGIGTGYSTFVPPYNPKDIKNNLKRLLNKEQIVPMKPWYKGFRGTVTQKEKHTWIFTGTIENGNNITELPPGRWIQDYKEFLDTLVETGKIKMYENHSTETHPNFVITWSANGSLSMDELKLSKAIHTSNMWLMTQNGIKKYDSPEEILFDYAKCRLSYYRLRKKNIIDTLNEKLSILNTRAKFINLVITEQIKVFRQSRTQIEQSMKMFDIDEHYWTDLLNIKTYQYTQEEIEKLNNQVKESESELQKTTQTSVADMWKYDIDSV